MRTESHQLISDDVKIGKNVSIYHFVNLYGCTIGDGSKIGSFVEIQKNANIGKNCKVSSHSFICEGVEIEDNVFVGHGVTFINDLFPRASTESGSLQTEKDWIVIPTFVRKNSSIGSGCTILAGIEIGENSIIGAGSMVTKSVAPNTIVAGNPARFIRMVK
jgi:acetyltransferase-like isoleucine patch superfamily enzyme